MASMLLKIGTSYSFAANSTEIASEGELLWNEGGQPYAICRRLRIEGYLAADGQAALTAAQEALDLALIQFPLGDVVLYQDDGTTPSATSLLNASSISGVRLIEGPTFPQTKGPEYATLRSFRFGVEATYPLTGSKNLLLSFHETMTFAGGGPTYAHLPCINGPPQKQLIYPLVPYTAVQEGETVGYRGYPLAPPPQWPNDLKEPPQIVKRSPKRHQRGYEEYPLSYRYSFESVAPFVGLPNIWV